MTISTNSELLSAPPKDKVEFLLSTLDALTKPEGVNLGKTMAFVFRRTLEEVRDHLISQSALPASELLKELE